MCQKASKEQDECGGDNWQRYFAVWIWFAIFDKKLSKIVSKSSFLVIGGDGNIGISSKEIFKRNSFIKRGGSGGLTKKETD